MSSTIGFVLAFIIFIIACIIIAISIKWDNSQYGGYGYLVSTLDVIAKGAVIAALFHLVFDWAAK